MPSFPASAEAVAFGASAEAVASGRSLTRNGDLFGVGNLGVRLTSNGGFFCIRNAIDLLDGDDVGLAALDDDADAEASALLPCVGASAEAVA